MTNVCSWVSRWCTDADPFTVPDALLEECEPDAGAATLTGGKADGSP